MYLHLLTSLLGKWLFHIGCCVWLLLIALAGQSQEYTIAKLKLFPDREEVLIKDVTVDIGVLIIPHTKSDLAIGLIRR